MITLKSEGESTISSERRRLQIGNDKNRGLVFRFYTAGRTALLIFCLVIVTITIPTSCGGLSHDMTSPWVRSLSAVDADHAWFSIKSGQMFRTTNGGGTWDNVPLQAGNKAEMVYFLDHQLGWMVNRKREVWQTADGGNTWTLLASLTKGGEDDYLIPLK